MRRPIQKLIDYTITIWHWYVNSSCILIRISLFITVIADINFPVKSICKKGPTEFRADGHSIPNILEAIVKLMPIDAHDPKPVRFLT